MSYIVIPPEDNNDDNYFIAKEATDAVSAIIEVMEELADLDWSDDDFTGVWLVFDMNDAKKIKYEIRKELVECDE